jgi:tRNA pseudouridine38-40 synthase
VTLFDQEQLSTPAALSGPLVRVRMLIAYLGTGYRGFARTPGARTVAGELGEALEKILRHPVALTCAGRTDAGVHAWGQVVHFDTPVTDVELAAVQRSLNKMLGPGVVVRALDLAPDGFDARRSAVGRRYRYTVLNRAVPDPFLAPTSWLVAGPLDLRSMQLACDPLLGEHDFSAFCRRPPDKVADDALVRVVRDARWLDLGDGRLRFDIEARAFCHQMVRSLVGTMVAVGSGRKRAGDMAWVLRSRDRSLASSPAPAHGLCLWEVLCAQAWPSVADQHV